MRFYVHKPCSHKDILGVRIESSRSHGWRLKLAYYESNSLPLITIYLTIFPGFYRIIENVLSFLFSELKVRFESLRMFFVSSDMSVWFQAWLKFFPCYLYRQICHQ